MSRSELETAITSLLIGKNQDHVKLLLIRHFRVSSFSKLSTDQLAHALSLIEHAVYTGEIR